MNLVKKILAPTDLSSASESALDEAVGLARAMGASLTLLNVYQLPQPIPDPDLAFGAAVIQEAEGAARQLLEHTRTALRRRTTNCPPIELKVTLGAPHEEIVAEATGGGYDLVVMGTHGRKGFKRMLIGSVAERVVRLCSVPVLTVHPAEDAKMPARPSPSAR